MTFEVSPLISGWPRRGDKGTHCSLVMGLHVDVLPKSRQLSKVLGLEAVHDKSKQWREQMDPPQEFYGGTT